MRIELTQAQYESLHRIVERDTSFLESLQIVDYSLLLGHYPASSSPQLPLGLRPRAKLSSLVHQVLDNIGPEDIFPRSGKRDTFDSDDFTRGVLSVDGRWIYRMSIMDFMWNINKMVPAVMRAAGKVLPEQTITAEPTRYKGAFMKMLEEYVHINSR